MQHKSYEQALHLNVNCKDDVKYKKRVNESIGIKVHFYNIPKRETLQ